METKDFKKFFHGSTYTNDDQVSDYLLHQVEDLELNGDLDFIEFFNAIKANECGHIKSNTKPAEEFKGLLKGFYKIHYYQPNF